VKPSVGSDFSRISQATTKGAPGSIQSSQDAQRSPQNTREITPRPPQERPAQPGQTPDPADFRTSFKDALLAEIRKSKSVFYNTVVAQAQKIEVTGDRVTFTFSASQGTLRSMLEQNRTWLEPMAQQLAGRKVVVASGNGENGAVPDAPPIEAAKADRKTTLREQALADAGVQALLEVLPVEIRDVEEM
jgi:hypothetical protein